MRPTAGRLATIGTFDGVHRGHRLLLEYLKEQAAEQELEPAAFLFEEHPLALIAPERMPPQLTLFPQKAAMVSALGVEVIPLHFNQATRGLTSTEYFAKIHDEYGVRGLIIGHDNRIGSDRHSTFADYVRSGQRLGLTVKDAPVLPGVSSSAVRKKLLRGEVSGALEALGRPYTLTGEVVHGKHLGTGLGFPTANLRPAAPELLVPARGVYATLVQLPHESAPLPAVTNIGIRPTVDTAPAPVSIETYIPDFSADIYGEQISIGFIDRIRDEQRFGSLDELRAQMHADVDVALGVLCLHSK